MTPSRGRPAEAFWTIGPRQGELRSVELGAPVEGEVLVETLYSGVSRGTELLVFDGRVPPSEHDRMRAPHQEGAFPFPVKYGYSSVGRVVVGAKALLGRTVFCLYPHQTAYVVSERDVVPLPDGVPPARAVLAANLETALNAVWDSRLGPGDRVAVVGAGAVGALVAYLAGRHPGARVELVDLDATREELARGLGVEFRGPSAASKGADVVFHASGNPDGLATAIELAGVESTIVELSWFGDRPAVVPLGGAFHSRRLGIKASQVGSLPVERRPRWTHRRRLELALSLLTDARLDVLSTGESPFDELPSVMARLAAGEGAGCHRIVYPPAPPE